MANLPRVTVIILNYNGGDITENCLDSVLKTDYPHLSILLVDNHSRIEEYQNLKKKYQQKIRFVRTRRNLGYARGNNLGASLSTSKYLIFLNNDVVVSKNWVKKMVPQMENNSTVAFLQPKIKDLKNRKFFEYAGGAGGYLDFWGYPAVRGRIFGLIEEDVGQYNDAREIFWASGVCLMTRKKVFESLDGFDSFFFAYQEEIDLCFRARRNGYKICYEPKVTVYHLGGYTANKIPVQKSFLNHRNHLILMAKNLRIRDLMLLWPGQLVFDLAAIGYYVVFYHSGAMAMSVFKAHISFWNNIGKIWRQRLKSKYLGYGFERMKKQVYQGSLVLSCFVLRKKRWGQIWPEGRINKGRLRKIF